MTAAEFQNKTVAWCRWCGAFLIYCSDDNSYKWETPGCGMDGHVPRYIDKIFEGAIKNERRPVE